MLAKACQDIKPYVNDAHMLGMDFDGNYMLRVGIGHMLLERINRLDNSLSIKENRLAET